MPLVEYSDSESEPSDSEENAAPPAKRQKVSFAAKNDALPPLPATFRDLYSSTVRTSTQDDASLHGGRKRVVPHVQGNWPAHVYLEWCPEPEEFDALEKTVEAQQHGAKSSHGNDAEGEHGVCSLLHNELGVSLPLHISLSRPLVLKTEHKDGFLQRLKQAITSSGVHAFGVSPADLKWHPNEDRTRWFLVLRATDEGGELVKLLQISNAVAGAHDQPKLYEDDAPAPSSSKPALGEVATTSAADKLHISIAWSLRQPPAKSTVNPSESTNLPSSIQDLDIPFADVKVRIGQDVTSMALAPRRERRGS